ncbi:splicing factor [Scheffersomyces amazonensis]|uniref:splicing factor n=1 Tax=Scheffersomyces amazonensis TaxID=1078765 RepID=UPI00315C57A0
MEDYEKELLDDFGSDSDEHEQIEEKPELEVETEHEEKSEVPFEERLEELLRNYTLSNSYHAILNESNIENIDNLTKFSKILPLLAEIKSKIEEYSSHNDQDEDYWELINSITSDSEPQSQEYRFILSINELSTIINQEITTFYSLVKLQYKVVFPELESIVINPIDYVKIVCIIKQDLKGIRTYESELKPFITNEKILVIIMAALQQVTNQFILNDQDLHKLLSCCRLVLELDDLLHDLSSFISQKLSKIAPNVNAIIGSITTSQLLIATGSLKQLALTQACNLPAIGVRDLSSQTKNVSKVIRQTGYLYHSDIVKYLPDDIQRSVMRIISGKVILAARIDLSRSSPNGEFGQKYLDEIKLKIEKLLEPPENQPDKALPLPVEIKSKKRGGRRFRKMKERFQMSELRKAQNKMEFGKQEDSIMDSYGEEIGLGMSRSSGSNGRIGAIKINTNTNAKMSKAMTNRLQQSNKKANTQRNSIYDDDFDSIILANPASNKSNENGSNSKVSKLGGRTPNSWLSGITKTDDNENPLKRKKID